MDTLLCLFFILHLLGDFYLQTDELAKKKQANFQYTLLHCVIYGLAFVLSGLLVADKPYWRQMIFLIVCHFLIDMMKVVFETKLTKRLSKPQMYLMDQGLHVLSIIIVWLTMTEATPFLLDSFSTNIKHVLFLLLLLKPTNITFKIVFEKYQYSSDYQKGDMNDRLIKQKSLPTTVSGAGALIGDLERLIMGLLLFEQQFSAIGLILTAKSITRYNKIATDPAFSEYYLIGTLYSVLMTIASYLLIF